MDKVIVTSLLIIGSVAAAIVVVMAMGPSISLGSQSAVESSRAAADRMKTNTEIIAVGVDSVGQRIDAWVKNVGVATIDAVEKSDVFLIQPGTRFESIPYSGDPTSSSYWYGDLEENGLPWAKGDTLQITVELPTGDSILQDIQYLLRVSTPNGITAEKSFTR